MNDSTKVAIGRRQLLAGVAAGAALAAAGIGRAGAEEKPAAGGPPQLKLRI